LYQLGFGTREGTIMTSCVFAWEDRAAESSRFMRTTIDSFVGSW
jgi:myo-inositol catabolism protein IolH